MAKPKKSDSVAQHPNPIGSLVKPENIHNTQAPDFHSIYSNNVAFTMSAFDLSFIFGEITNVEDRVLNVNQKLRVTMSPQHAKAFALVLLQNLKTYEQTVGPIVLPAGMQQVTQTQANSKET